MKIGTKYIRIFAILRFKDGRGYIYINFTKSLCKRLKKLLEKLILQRYNVRGHIYSEKVRRNITLISPPKRRKNSTQEYDL